MTHAIKVRQPSPADLIATYAFLTESYWSPGVLRAIVAHACANSACAIARDLVRALQAHAELKNLRRWMLGTNDAQGVYAALGFEQPSDPDRYLARRRVEAPYGGPRG